MQQEEKSKQAGDDNDEVPENNDPHFEPIISLPALVEVKTGEEDETVMFSHRANLYRLHALQLLDLECVDTLLTQPLHSKTNFFFFLKTKAMKIRPFS